MAKEKNLIKPSFFTISNLGGGGSDKYRETVYLDILDNTPTLYNYFYLVQNNYSGTIPFAVNWLKNIENYNKFSDFIKYTREGMINAGYKCEKHKFKEYDYNKTIYLLDSGAANFINLLHKNIDYINETEKFKESLIEIMHQYYDFANKFKFDIVIGFDLGGKYTFKGSERIEESIINGNKLLKKNSLDLNEYILDETIKYIKSKDSFYPKIYATVHGKSKEEYANYTKLILKKEIKNNFKFDGFALGGIANCKGLDLNSWGITEENISSLKKVIKKTGTSLECKNALVSSIACKEVSKLVGNRPIHALGAGGKLNIIPLWSCGATSFDSQTPGRRAYDGSGKCITNFNSPSNGDTFSKYLPGILNSRLESINKDVKFEYIKINEVNDSIVQCQCESCVKADLGLIKELYCDSDKESYYYARQLINMHAVHQHNYLCKLIYKYKNLDDILSNLNREDLSTIIKYIINFCN